MKFKEATPIVLSLLLALATLTSVVGSLPCDNPSPIEEKAYVGAYEIYFPDTQSNCFFQPAQCRWKILAYRNDYVINLEFSDVNLTHGDFLNSCSERITVYDGPDVTDLVLADFCGLRSPSIVTSSRETLVVFRSNESPVTTGRFRLKYKAINDKVNDDDSSQVLRIAFGGFIGAVAFVIICSGAIRRYKYGRSNGPVFLFFGRHRVDTTAMPSTAGSRHAGGCPATRRRTANESAPQEAESASLRNRVAGFFHESHNLVRANSFMRGLSRTDSLLFLYKLQNETRRFKVKFSALENKTGQEVCAEAILVLSNFITIKTNINIKDQSSEGNNLIGCQMPGTHEQSIAALNNSPLHGEVTVGTMAKALLDRTNLPSAYYQCQSDSELIPQLLQTCLADPTFPAYVEAVEAKLKQLISNDS